MVVEDNSSPMNEVTSRTELDVTEEAENEQVETEDEWIKEWEEKVLDFWRQEASTLSLYYFSFFFFTFLQSLHYPSGTASLIDACMG